MDIINRNSVHYGTNFNDFFSDYSYVTNEIFYTESNEPILSSSSMLTETILEDEHNSCTESCFSVHHYSNQNLTVLTPFQCHSKEDIRYLDYDLSINTKSNIDTRIKDIPGAHFLSVDHICISSRYNRDEIYLSIDQYLLEKREIFSNHFITNNIKESNLKEECWLIQILKGMHYSKCILKLYYNSINDNFFLNCSYLNGYKNQSQELFHGIFHIFEDSEFFIHDIISTTPDDFQESSNVNVTNYQFYNNPDNIKLIDELIKSLEISNYPEYQRNAILTLCDLSQEVELHKLLYSKDVVKSMIDVCIILFSNEPVPIYQSSYEISELIMYILLALSNFLVYKEAYVYMKASITFSNLLLKFCRIDIIHDDLELVIRSISERIRASMVIF